MRRKLFTLILPLILAMSATSTWAADDDEVKPDARLEGFRRSDAQPNPMPLVITPASGNATTWLLFVLLTGGCVAAMCKNGKRTHLD